MEKITMNRNKLMLLTLVVAAVLALTLTTSLQARPAVTWEPAKLQETVVNASVATTTVSFTAKEDLPSVITRVVPELESFVTVEPQVLGHVPSDESRTLQIRFAIPPDTPPQELEGTIQLRHDGKPPKTHSRPLPVELTIEQINLPPDPGEEGEETLAGVDSDGDGLRDDIQRYIALEYWEEPSLQLALRQYAQSLQSTIEDVEAMEPDDVDRIDTATARAESCVRFREGSERGLTLLSTILAEVLNTEERSLAYFAYLRKLSGGPLARFEVSEAACLNQ